MTITLGTFGEVVALQIRQGATFGPFTAQMFNPDGVTPVDLTGCTVRAHIRARAKDPVILAALNASITDAPAGKYEFGLTDEQTALLPAGETVKDAESKAVWDLELEDSTGRVLALYYGPVTVFREVTRP